MKNTENLINELSEILSANESDRLKKVNHFQNEVWNNVEIESEQLEDIISELAYDLSFYEPDINKRNEFNMYYGDEQLEKEIRETLDLIIKLSKTCN